jgi:Mg-chelatase subunit ChlI
VRSRFSCAGEPSALFVDEVDLVIDRLRAQLRDLAYPSNRFLRDDLDKDAPVQVLLVLTMERLGWDGELGSAFLADEPVRGLEVRLPTI